MTRIILAIIAIGALSTGVFLLSQSSDEAEKVNTTTSEEEQATTTTEVNVASSTEIAQEDSLDESVEEVVEIVEETPPIADLIDESVEEPFVEEDVSVEEVVQAESPPSEEIPILSSAPETGGNTLPLTDASSTLMELEPNIEAIVLVRCTYKTQYFYESSVPYEEIDFSFGTGVVVSDKGHILTAGHVLKGEDEIEGKAGRVWTKEECNIALTESAQASIKSNKKFGIGGESWFYPVEILFDPSDELYNDGSDLDIAIIRLTDDSINLPYIKLENDLFSFGEDDFLTAVGYPGKSAGSDQFLERFDAWYGDIGTVGESSCREGDFDHVCGWRYIVGRYFPYVKRFVGYDTELGKISAHARGGYSGGPVFYKGNMVGISTHATFESDGTASEGYEFLYVLNGRDIIQTLKDHGITL